MDGRIEGSITIDGSSDPGSHAHLRWFIVSERLQGQGAGKRLLQQAMDFCRSRQYEHVYLDTFKGLDSAHHLYEKYGFILTREEQGEQWGSMVTEQRFECTRLLA
jgi:ribosomal protein S18 acetylase RimI-like enzyme